MRYTQGQLRDLTGLSVASLRAWRGVVPFLAERKGHAPTFTPGDLVAVAALGQLVGSFGVRIGGIAEQAQALLEECHQQSWLALEDCTIVMDSRSARLERSDSQRPSTVEAAWVVPCRALIASLRESLSSTDYAEQAHLQFPPVAVGERS